MAKKATTKKTDSTKAAVKKSAAPKEAAVKKTTPVIETVAPVIEKTTPVDKPVAKKAPAKKAVAKKEVAKEVPAKKAAPKAAPKPTTIVAKIDIGFGNELFLRGEGAGLSWTAGVLMDCTADDEWTYTLPADGSEVLVKFLINDAAWSEGDNYSISAGETNVIEPKF